MEAAILETLLEVSMVKDKKEDSPSMKTEAQGQIFLVSKRI